MKPFELDTLKLELEQILRRQSTELNNFAQKISDRPEAFTGKDLLIALRLSDQALVHATRTQLRLKEVKHISLVREISS